MEDAPPRHGGNVQQLARRLNCHPRRILDFSASLVPFGPPPSLRRALRRAWNDHVVAPYPDPSYQALREAMAQAHDLDPGWILPGNGAAELLTWAARDAQSFLSLLPTPGFADYPRALATWGAPSRSLPLRLHWEDGPQSWVEALAEPRNLHSPNPGRTALWITNPHNPTGQLWRRDSLEPLLHHHGLLVVDEAFLPLVPNGEKHSLVSLVPRFGNLVVIRSLTKLFAMAGLRLGYAVAPPARLARWQSWRDPWPVNALAVQGGMAVLADPLWQQRVWRWLAREGPWLTQHLNRQCPSLQVHPGAANYRLLSASHPLTPLQQFLAQQGILVRDCRSFPGLDDRWLRIAVGKRRHNRKLVAAMVAGLKHLDRQPSATPERLSS